MLTKVYFVVVFCIILIFSFRDLENNRVFVKRPKFEKLTANGFLIKCLRALNRVIDFSSEHKNNIDVSFYFGLFLVNVNLKRAVQEKYQVLPNKLHCYIKKIIRKTENVLKFFTYRIDQNHDLRSNKYKAILMLFGNATTWINRLPKLNTIRLIKTDQNLNKVNTNWILYRKNIDDRDAWVPNPHQSDFCLASLATAEKVQNMTSTRCRVLKSCLHMVQNGTDFGYALAHRLLFLQLARFARGCNIFSEEEDRQLIRRFCTAAYQEAVYIARHDFEIVDLFLEHVCLCASVGYAQFLRRSWLTKILGFQMLQGCFSPYSQSIPKVLQPSDNVLDGYCNGHTTAVAATTLALASRFILQMYY